MSELVSAVTRLVEVATRSSKDRELGPAVQAVMNAFDESDGKGVKAAFRVLDAGLVKAKGRGAQVLHLALGALVEAGAPPELAWPAVERGLGAILDGATRYADACLEAADVVALDDAVRTEGAKIAKKLPRDFEAWEALKSRCLAGVAVLSRSAKLRARTQKSALVEAAYPLEDAVEEVGFLSQIMRVVEDQTILVIHPGQRRGFRLDIHEIATNLELFVLVLDAIVGDPAKGLLKGARPNPRAVALIKDPEAAPKKIPAIKVPWHTTSWQSLLADGTLPDDPDNRHPKRWVWLEGVPAEIPPFERERVILLTKPIMARSEEVEPAFSALSPQVRLRAKLSGAEVDRLLRKMGKVAAKLAAEEAVEEEKTARAEAAKYERAAKKAAAARAAKRKSTRKSPQ